jgi:hypothetical protein
MKARRGDESLSQFTESILLEVEKDEKTLQNLAKAIGTGSNILKEAAAWVGEKASRVKLGAGSSGDFETFEALEFLSLGIQGKLSLWHACKSSLSRIAEQYPADCCKGRSFHQSRIREPCLAPPDGSRSRLGFRMF